MKKVILADIYGFCSGVKRAIKIAEKASRDLGPNQVFVWKDIVHNQHVVNDLKRQGVEPVTDISFVPRGKTVIWSAHGVVPEMWERARSLGLNIMDATCPLVTRVHQLAREASERGDMIIYLGDEGHDEQVGVKGEVKASFVTIKSVNDIKNLIVDNPTRVTVLTQTTLSKDETEEILAILRKKFPEAKIFENICKATTERQEAVKKLVKQVEIIVVVGSPKSANSQRLKKVAEKQGVKAILVDNARELKLDQLSNYRKIGITAGASTPDWILKGIINKLKRL